MEASGAADCMDVSPLRPEAPLTFLWPAVVVVGASRGRWCIVRRDGNG